MVISEMLFLHRGVTWYSPLPLSSIANLFSPSIVSVAYLYNPIRRAERASESSIDSRPIAEKIAKLLMT